MNNYLKYLKAFVYILVLILILNLLSTVLYYFNILNDGNINYLKLLNITFSMLIGGIYIGTKVEKKGWLEGLKLGLGVILLLLIISLLFFSIKFNLKNIIYYFIILVATILGSMIGINRKNSK